MRYDPAEVERRWQRRWSEGEVFRSEADRPGEKFFCLEMLPYPSGRIHMGHVRNYAIGDAVAWFERMSGKNVFHAIGWDAMGLPAENAALRHGVAPARWTLDNIDQMREQLKRLGFSYDWRREIATCHPGYYRWNQWFFLKMLEHDLAYRARRALNWCSECSTVLANEQVTASGGCWRHENNQVTQVELDQWFIRTTRFADRLLEGLDRLGAGWPERVVAMQKHWVGRSEGCRFSFAVEGDAGSARSSIEVFTTRVDTVFGCSAVFVAPQHPALDAIVRGGGREEEVRQFVAEESAGGGPGEDEREKKGVFTGRHATNPFNGERVPIWVANFVLMEFGTGAVFAQPAHDERDFEFARKFGLAIRAVVRPEGGELPETVDEPFTGEGILERSGDFTGLPTGDARARMIEHAARKGFGRAETQYRLKDWGVSRQRYWGTPIPVVYCEGCGIVPVPESDLPVLLPAVEDWKGATGSPLASIPEFVETPCPRCGGPGRRETDTMDTFVDSSWYFLRYLDPRNEEAPFSKEAASYWMPVDLYVGGIEHAVGHLIYARVWAMMLHDMGLLSTDEPVTRLYTQGMITAASYRCPAHGFIDPREVGASPEGPRCPQGGEALEMRVEKMSKSKLNSVSPDELIDRYGSDALRLFSMFGGPPVKDLEWNEQGIEGSHRFVHRVARLFERLAPAVRGLDPSQADALREAADGDALRLRRKTHKTIQKVTRDIEVELQLNTAIAALMELVNELYRLVESESGIDTPELSAAVAESLDVLTRLLAPFAPHLAEEMNDALGRPEMVATMRWPKADPGLLVEDELVLPVQINGKLRGQIEAPRGAGQDDVMELVRADGGIARHLEGKTIARVVHVPDRLVNLVVR